MRRVVEAITGRVSAARGARALHPRGRAFEGTVRTFGTGDHGLGLLDRAGQYRALVRFSRGLGLPSPWPDVLGVALRLCDADGPGAHLDLLVSTTLGGAPLARHVPVPRRRLATTYTTVVGYGTRRGQRYLAVLPDPTGVDLGDSLDSVAAAAARGSARLLLAAATGLGRWRVFGRLEVGAPVPSEDERMLAFDPAQHRVPDLRTDGWFWRLRRAAYRGSRAGRGSRLAADPGADACGYGAGS